MKRRKSAWLLAFGFCAWVAWLCASRAAEEPVSTKITLRSLVLLEDELRTAPDAQSKAKTAKRILAVGAPLVDASMKPSQAESVAQSLKSGSDLPEDQKGYVGFWLLRGLAAVKADDEVAGLQSAKVLKALDIPNSNKQAEIDVIAALNAKGWLDTEAVERKKREATAAKKAAQQRQADAEKVRKEKAERREALLRKRESIAQQVQWLHSEMAKWQSLGDSDGITSVQMALDKFEPQISAIDNKLRSGDY